MAIDTKFRVGTFFVPVICGWSWFEKNTFEDTEKPTQVSQERVSRGNNRGIESFIFILKLFLRPILCHGKFSFDNLTYFKLYGSLKL